MNPLRPLEGRHVLITRGGDQGNKFCLDVASRGGIPHIVPLIDFRAHIDSNADYFIHNISQYDWIVFTSKNGVHYFFEQINNRIDRNDLLNVQYAVVGEKTREALNGYQISSKFMPNVYTAEEFANEFFEHDYSPKKVLIPKGNLASTTVADSFRKRSIIADEWIVYETFYPENERNRLVQLLREDILDVVAFTSPSTFHHFMQIVHEYQLSEHSQKLMYASIGTVTKRAIEKESYNVKICPRNFTLDDLFQEICHYFLKLQKERKEKI